jgi:serine O-acetyltransferase
MVYGVSVIRSKEDYIYYLEADRQSLEITKKRPSIFEDEIWKFERVLRKVEYYTNCKKGFFSKVYLLFLKWKFHKLSIQLGYHIQPNVFGPGLALHWQLVGIHGAAKIGANCRIQASVNIGTKAGESSFVPKIGDNVYIGPGAKIFGDITIADGIAIGANAVVNKSFLEPGISIGGIPAKKISDKGSEGLLTKGTELADAALKKPEKKR